MGWARPGGHDKSSRLSARGDGTVDRTRACGHHECREAAVEAQSKYRVQKRRLAAWARDARWRCWTFTRRSSRPRTVDAFELPARRAQVKRQAAVLRVSCPLLEPHAHDGSARLGCERRRGRGGTTLLEDRGDRRGDRQHLHELALLQLGMRGDQRTAPARERPALFEEVVRRLHSTLDHHGFITMFVAAARKNGFSAYISDGANMWPAVHTLGAARLYRLAL